MNTFLNDDYKKKLTELRNVYLSEIRPFRQALFRYCLALTGNAFDAEDLSQETILKCFARWIDLKGPSVNIKAYHFKTALHTFLNQQAKHRPELTDAIDAPCEENSAKHEFQDIRDLALVVAAELAPREGSMLMLKDVFDFSLEECAQITGTTTGACKAALSRARQKLKDFRQEKKLGSKRVISASKTLIEDFVTGLNKRDPKAILSLLADDATSHVVGCGMEMGIDAIAKGSIGITTSYDNFVSAEIKHLHGEPVVVLYEKNSQDTTPETKDLIILSEQKGKISELRFYYFCPDVLDQLGHEMKIPFKSVGYHHEFKYIEAEG